MKNILKAVFVWVTLLITLMSFQKGSGKSVRTDSKETIALQFINSYVANANLKNNAVEIRQWVAKNKNATAHFKATLKRMVDNAEAQDPELGLGFDPIFNAQDYPEEGFSVVSSDKLGFIILQGKKWRKFELQMRLIKVAGKWKVDGCGAVNIPRETLINPDEN